MTGQFRVGPEELDAAGNVCRTLWEAAASWPAHPAVIDGDGVVSYADLLARAEAIAAELWDLGIRPGDRVGILLSREADAAAAFFGALATGAIAVMMSDLLRPRQMEHVLTHSSAAVLITSGRIRERWPRTLEVATTQLDVREIAASGEFEPRSRLGLDPAQIVYTSGSTGLPKGVTVSHANLWAGLRSVTSYLAIEQTDRIASLLPFSFDYGLNQLLCAVGTGATLVIERSPVAARIVQTLTNKEVTVVAGVPTLWLQLLQTDAFQAHPIPSLRVLTNSGGRIPVEAVRRIRSCQRAAELVLMYGLTEAFRSTYLPADRVDLKPNSIGRAIPGAEVHVVNDDLTVCEPREVGELIHRGPTVALGYWNDPDATAGVYRPNPLRPAGTPDSERVVFSGDLGYRDEDGDLYHVGRRDAMIKTLGYRVSPDEILDALYASGEIAEGIVTSEPDPLRGARIVAYVVLIDGGRLETLEAFAQRELPRYMHPSRIEVRASLERTASGKLDLASIARSSA